MCLWDYLSSVGMRACCSRNRCFWGSCLYMCLCDACMQQCAWGAGCSILNHTLWCVPQSRRNRVMLVCPKHCITPATKIDQGIQIAMARHAYAKCFVLDHLVSRHDKICMHAAGTNMLTLLCSDNSHDDDVTKKTCRTIRTEHTASLLQPFLYWQNTDQFLKNHIYINICVYIWIKQNHKHKKNENDNY